MTFDPESNYKFRVNRISAIAPPKKRTKNDARGRDRVEIYRKIMPGIELAARHQRKLERAGSFTRSRTDDLLLAIARYSARSKQAFDSIFHKNLTEMHGVSWKKEDAEWNRLSAQCKPPTDRMSNKANNYLIKIMRNGAFWLGYAILWWHTFYFLIPAHF